MQAGLPENSFFWVENGTEFLEFNQNRQMLGSGPGQMERYK